MTYNYGIFKNQITNLKECILILKLSLFILLQVLERLHTNLNNIAVIYGNLMQMHF